MKNPAEEIVTAWLQECKGFFTMNNIKVPKEKGGMGAEIDILATDVTKNIWVEVSVSTNPRQSYRKDVKFDKTIEDYLKDFQREDKNLKVEELFHGKKFEKWLVYGKLALTKDETAAFPNAIAEGGVKAVYFGDIINDLMQLKHYRLDSARGYMNLFKTFYSV